MPPDSEPRPALTLAIPTFDRAGFLEVLLGGLEPQLLDAERAWPGAIEVLIVDNGSEDRTQEVVTGAAERLRAGGLAVRAERHATNIGSDANFVYCYEQARGHYFWLCGDDDVIVPGGLKRICDVLRDGLKEDDLDLVYLSSYGFVQDPVAERKEDPMGRILQTARSARHFAMLTGTMVTFISGMIVNRARLEGMQHEAPRAFIGTNLTQLSWTLPLLRAHRRSVVLWERVLGGRQANSGGYSMAAVFGEKFCSLTDRLLPNDPDIAKIFKNFVIRRWFPENIYAMRRRDQGDRFGLHEAESVLRRTFGKNFRFWLFAWPVLRLPLGLAGVWFKAGALMSKGLYMLRMPGFWRKRT